jgi:hypothetical protein
MTEKLEILGWSHVGRMSKLPAKFENFQRFPNKVIPLILL